MLLLRLSILLVAVVGIAFVITQIIVPLISRTILFPIFRRDRSVVLKQIQEAKAQLADEELKDELQTLQEQLKAKQQADSEKVTEDQETKS